MNFLFVNASYQLDEFECGMTAALFGAVPAAVLGGLGTIAVAFLWMMTVSFAAQGRAIV